MRTMSTFDIELFEDRHDLPRLGDIINFRENGTPDEQLYFGRFGFDQLVIPEDCPHIIAKMPTLTTRFNDMYFYRRIAQETMPRWQMRMQVRCDAIVHRYERAYALYEEYQQRMDDDMIEGERETVTGTRSALSGVDETTSSTSGESSSNDVTKVVDTPDSAVNDNENYADAYTKNTSEGNSENNGVSAIEYGRKDDVDMQSFKEYVGRQIMQNVNLSIESWMDIDTAFIGEFKNMFINIWD